MSERIFGTLEYAADKMIHDKYFHLDPEGAAGHLALHVVSDWMYVDSLVAGAYAEESTDQVTQAEETAAIQLHMAYEAAQNRFYAIDAMYMSVRQYLLKGQDLEDAVAYARHATWCSVIKSRYIPTYNKAMLTGLLEENEFAYHTDRERNFASLILFRNV